jgi:hypothetical protein
MLNHFYSYSKHFESIDKFSTRGSSFSLLLSTKSTCKSKAFFTYESICLLSDCC